MSVVFKLLNLRFNLGANQFILTLFSLGTWAAVGTRPLFQREDGAAAMAPRLLLSRLRGLHMRVHPKSQLVDDNFVQKVIDILRAAVADTPFRFFATAPKDIRPGDRVYVTLSYDGDDEGGAHV